MLGTSTRTSDVLINLGLNPLRWLREVESPQFGVLSARAPPSPRCTALTAASCENHGAAPNFGTRVPGIFAGKVHTVMRVRRFSEKKQKSQKWRVSPEDSGYSCTIVRGRPMVLTRGCSQCRTPRRWRCSRREHPELWTSYLP